MDLLHQNLSAITGGSFKTVHINRPYFNVPLHCHPEVEIMSIIRGTGTRLVGDSVENFSEGDLVLVGSNTPHVWRNNKDYYDKRNDLIAECMVLFIPPKIFGESILTTTEMTAINRMLIKGKRGIKFKKKKAVSFRKILFEVFEFDGPERMLKVLELLHKMSKCKKKRYLSSIGYSSDFKGYNLGRLTKCLSYLLEHFDEKIELDKMADIANMTPNSFCRYFKKRTEKTFSEFLIYLRISKACRLLMESDKTVIEIAFEVGFSSLSNFNDHFKKIKKVNPRTFRLKNQSLMI